MTPQSWFGPQQPLQPQAPPEVKGRQFDYPFGANLNYVPRSEGGIGFAELRALADALPLLRAVIETRKDQVAAQNFTVRARAGANLPDQSARIDRALAFIARPDRRRSFGDWLRMLIEDLLVIDAATIYPRYDRGGKLYALDVIDGATIKPLIGEDGRAPEPPDPAYQQAPHCTSRRLFRRGAALPAPQRASAPALRHEPGRARSADRQYRAPARGGDARLLPHGKFARRLRHFAEGVDDRPRRNFWHSERSCVF